MRGKFFPQFKVRLRNNLIYRCHYPTPSPPRAREKQKSNVLSSKINRPSITSERERERKMKILWSYEKARRNISLPICLFRALCNWMYRQRAWRTLKTLTNAQSNTRLRSIITINISNIKIGNWIEGEGRRLSNLMEKELKLAQSDLLLFWKL